MGFSKPQLFPITDIQYSVCALANIAEKLFVFVPVRFPRVYSPGELTKPAFQRV
jgi:hypothetical protein